MPSGARPAQIDVALFTHMHTDHITDVPDFLVQRWTGGATTPLRVHGPDGTREMIDGFLLALRRDIGFRRAHHGAKLHPDGIAVEVTEVSVPSGPEEFLAIDGLRFEAFEVDHRPVVPAFGYRATYAGRTAVLSGDTSFCELLADAAAGADLLVYEALNAPMLDQVIAMIRGAGRVRDAGMLAGIPSYHINTSEIAALCRRAGVGEVVLSHVIPPIQNDAGQEAAFLAGMADVYGGPIRVARDMQRFAVPRKGV